MQLAEHAYLGTCFGVWSLEIAILQRMQMRFANRDRCAVSATRGGPTLASAECCCLLREWKHSATLFTFCFVDQFNNSPPDMRLYVAPARRRCSSPSSAPLNTVAATLCGRLVVPVKEVSKAAKQQQGPGLEGSLLFTCTYSKVLEVPIQCTSRRDLVVRTVSVHAALYPNHASILHTRRHSSECFLRDNTASPPYVFAPLRNKEPQLQPPRL